MVSDDFCTTSFCQDRSINDTKYMRHIYFLTDWLIDQHHVACYEAVVKPFGIWTGVDRRNHILGLDGVQILACEHIGLRDSFEGKGAAHCKVYGPSALSCAIIINAQQ